MGPLQEKRRAGLQKPAADASRGLLPGTHVDFLPVLQSANHWLHLVAAAVWVGGIVFFLFVFGPAVHSLAPSDGVRALNHGRESLQFLSWIAIHLLFLTGVLNFFFRVTAGPVHPGTPYYWILALKLLFFFAMVFHHFLQTFKYAPKIVALTDAAGGGAVAAWPEALLAAWKKWFMLLKINLTLGVIILLLGLVLSWR
jgi:uncharacterized membrane protein